MLGEEEGRKQEEKKLFDMCKMWKMHIYATTRLDRSNITFQTPLQQPLSPSARTTLSTTPVDH